MSSRDANTFWYFEVLPEICTIETGREVNQWVTKCASKTLRFISSRWTVIYPNKWPQLGGEAPRADLKHLLESVKWKKKIAKKRSLLAHLLAFSLARWKVSFKSLPSFMVSLWCVAFLAFSLRRLLFCLTLRDIFSSMPFSSSSLVLSSRLSSLESFCFETRNLRSEFHLFLSHVAAILFYIWRPICPLFGREKWEKR